MEKLPFEKEFDMDWGAPSTTKPVALAQRKKHPRFIAANDKIV